MHLIETYSNNVGIKLPQNGVAPREAFYPTPEKYITIHNGAGFESKIYDYFQDVIAFIKKDLNKLNIKIVQIGLNNEKHLNGCEDYRGKTNFSQCSYIVKNSLCHIGADSVWSHVAGLYNVPVIGLFGSTLPKVSGPYYKNDKTVLLESHRGGNKASLSVFENPKTINFINREDIINSIYKILEINKKCNYKSIFTGQNYQNFIFEYLPDKPLLLNLTPQTVLNIRLDRSFNETNAFQTLSRYKSTLITSKSINQQLIAHQNTQLIIYDVEDENELDLNFVRFLERVAKPYQVITNLKEERLGKLKIKLFDFKPVMSKKDYFPLFGPDENLYFKSSRILISGNQTFLSYWHYLNNKPQDRFDNFERGIPNTKDIEFWENQDNIFVYELLI